MLLSDDAFNVLISSSIDDFVALNKKDSVSFSLLWESLKAYLRGQIISYSAYSNKICRAKLQELTFKNLDTDRLNSANPSPNLLKQWLDLQSEFDLIATTDAERLLLRSCANYYEYGNKLSRLLHSIRDSTGSLTTDPTAINTLFKSYYSSLYESDSPPDPAEMTSFFENLNAPIVDPDVANGLDAPFNFQEIAVAIKSMQSNKVPGPDGFGVKFFKKIIDKLAPLLLPMYNEYLDHGL